MVMVDAERLVWLSVYRVVAAVMAVGWSASKTLRCLACRATEPSLLSY